VDQVKFDDVFERARACYSADALKKAPTRDEMLDFLQATIECLVTDQRRLESRIAELEAREYRGPHEDGKCYTRGQYVSFKGSLWHCNCETTQRPGDGPAWTLAVKAGRDGKDAR